MRHKTSKISFYRDILFGFAAVIAAFVAADLGIEFIEAKYTPHTYWFDYTKVRPTKFQYKLTERPTFVSESYFRKPVRVEWHEILYCESKEGAFYRVGDDRSAHYNIGPKALALSPAWTYHGPRPPWPTTCYLVSTITAHVGYGQKKVLVMNKDARYKFQFI